MPGMGSPEAIKIIRGKIPPAFAKEYKEMMNYDVSKVDEDVKDCKGPFSDPWLNAVHHHEPAPIPGYEQIKDEDFFRQRVRGKVLDMGAGTCWLSAKLSLLPAVDEVYALDLSERFLTRIGTRIIETLQGKPEKITFVASDFNEVPLASGSIDCVLLWASLHHSLSPIKTLQEAGRCLKTQGSLFIFENPPSTIQIKKSRERTLAMSEQVTEMTYTRDEWIYFMKAAKIGDIKIHTLDILSRRGWRLAIRKFLRRFDVEHLILNPPNYLFHIEKP